MKLLPGFDFRDPDGPRCGDGVIRSPWYPLYNPIQKDGHPTVLPENM